MNTLHTVLQPPRRETDPRRDHLEIFREFLDHLDRAARRRGVTADKAKAQRGDK